MVPQGQVVVAGKKEEEEEEEEGTMAVGLDLIRLCLHF